MLDVIYLQLSQIYVDVEDAQSQLYYVIVM